MPVVLLSSTGMSPNEAELTVNSVLPRRILRYLPPERVDCLRNEEVCFTPPLRFNDPFDLCPVILPVTNRAFWEARFQEGILVPDPKSLGWPRGKTRRVISKEKRKFVEQCLANPQRIMDKLISGIVQTINETLGVLCFSRVNDDLLMWAHYADKYKGFVVEFDSEASEFRNLGKLRRVTYSADRPVLDPTAPARIEPFLKKSTHWAYEQEFRIVCRLQYCERRLMNGVELFFVHLPRSCIKAVFFGNRIPPDAAKQISEAMAGSPAQLFQAHLHSREYRLVFNPLEQV